MLHPKAALRLATVLKTGKFYSDVCAVIAVIRYP